MKKSLLSISLHAATVCAFALLSPSAVAQTSATSTTGAGGTTAAGAKAKPLSAAEKKFIKDASESVYYALHLTGMAEKNASATPTKEVAKSIKEDGDKIWEELGAIAQAKGEKMTTDLSGGDKSSSERLGKNKEDKFDKPFLKELSKEVKRLATAFQTAAKSAQDPEVKTFAEKWLPTLKKHEEAADKAESEAGKRKA